MILKDLTKGTDSPFTPQQVPPSCEGSPRGALPTTNSPAKTAKWGKRGFFPLRPEIRILLRLLVLFLSHIYTCSQAAGPRASVDIGKSLQSLHRIIRRYCLCKSNELENSLMLLTLQCSFIPSCLLFGDERRALPSC